MKPFRFMVKYDQALLLGRRATNLRELLDGIETVPSASVFFHTHRSLQQQYRLVPEPPNDFAFWITNNLGYDRLGEECASIDIIQFCSVSDLRDTFSGILRRFLEKNPHTDTCAPGHEFYFMSCQTFVLPTSYEAKSVREFRENLEKVGIHAIRYHVLDQMLRGGACENDFSTWLRDAGHAALAENIARLDPYTQTLEGLRNRIIELAKNYEKD